LRVNASSASSPRRLVTSSRWPAVKIGGFSGTDFGRDAEGRRREGFLDILGTKKALAGEPAPYFTLYFKYSILGGQGGLALDLFSLCFVFVASISSCCTS
jgi:hypothetical protein